MPEGDTIYRAAATLSRVLVGQVIEKCVSYVADVRPEYLEGKKVVSVESQGKNLLIHFNNGYVLHTHMRMNGSWHIYRTGERWQRPKSFARLVLQVPEFQAVCFSAPVIRLFTSKGLKTYKRLSGLGPDVLKLDQWDPALIRKRFREHPDLEIGEALLRQQILAGLGNIYKNESLFLERVWPFDTVRSLPDSSLERLIERAASLMGKNLSGEIRSTRPFLTQTSRYWVYKRSGKPCGVCGEIICMRCQGNQLRSTYYCPGCQKPQKQPGVPYPCEIGSEP